MGSKTRSRLHRASLRPDALAWLACLFALGAVPVLAEDPVLVNITGPLAARVGDKVAFEVELVNRSGRPLTGLRVVDYFDKGFHHPASASPIEQRGTIDLAAGTSRRLTLDFSLDEPGRQCHRVEILDQAHTFMGGATECVQVSAATLAQPSFSPPAVVAAPPVVASPPPVVSTPQYIPPPVMPAPVMPAPVMPAPVIPSPVVPPAPVQPPAPVVQTQPVPATPPVLQPLASASTSPVAAPSLELDLNGPGELMSGAVAEYSATVRNTGTAPAPPTKLEFSWDGAFAPLEASDGYKLGSSSVSWDLPAIEPGGQLRRQINLRAQAPMTSFRDSPASRSCVRSVLSGLVGGVMVADESCVMVRSTATRPRTPREAGLRVALADLDDPVQVGGATNLVCIVSNNGSSPSGRLDLVVVLPDQSRLVGDPTPSRVRIDGSTIAFDSISSLPPGGQATFELAYRMSVPGAAKATAILTGAELDGSLDSVCTTSFGDP